MSARDSDPKAPAPGREEGGRFTDFVIPNDNDQELQRARAALNHSVPVPVIWDYMGSTFDVVWWHDFTCRRDGPDEDDGVRLPRSRRLEASEGWAPPKGAR